MTVESATYITQLNTAFPQGVDPRSRGDDHLRLIKAVLQNTFPGLDQSFTDQYFISVKDSRYGAVGDGVTDDTAAIQAAIDSVSSGGRLDFPFATYIITSPLVFSIGVDVYFHDCTIEKNTNTAGSGSQLARSGAVVDSYAVDSIISIKAGNNNYVYNVNFHGHCTLDGTAASNNTYGVYAPRTSGLDFENQIQTKKCDFGFYTFDSWLGNINVRAANCTSAIKFADDGTSNATGTSMILRGHANTAVDGYDLYGLQYSTLESPAVDPVSGSAYKIDTCSGLTLNSPGAENITGGRFLKVSFSTVVINSPRALAVTGVDAKAYIDVEGSSSVVVINGGTLPDFDSVNGTNYQRLVKTGAKLITIGTILPTNGSTVGSFTSGAIHVDYQGDQTVFHDTSGSITTEARISDQTPSLQNSWVDVVGAEAIYYRHGEVVSIQGAISAGTTTDSTLLFTLASGYRPSTEQWIPVVNDNAGTRSIAIIRIQANGQVQIYDATGNTYLRFDGITFKVT